MHIWLRAFASAAIVSVAVAAAVSFLGGTTTEYSPGIAWDEVKDLPHSQAVELINSRAKEVSVVRSFGQNIRDPWHWQIFATYWAALFAMCFVACSILLVSLRRRSST